MHNRQEQTGSSFNTFLFGVLIGVLATLLFTTKKGRKLLKVITDESVDRLGKWEDMVKTMQEHIDEDVEDESVMGEEVQKIAPSHSEKIEIDPSASSGQVESEMPDVDELPHIKIDKLEKKESKETDETKERNVAEEENPKKKPRRLFKNIRKKSV